MLSQAYKEDRKFNALPFPFLSYHGKGREKLVITDVHGLASVWAREEMVSPCHAKYMITGGGGLIRFQSVEM